MIILIFLFLIPVWLFLAPIKFQVDTRIPEICFRWVSVGNARLVFEQNKWWLKISVLFFFKRWELEELILKGKKKARKVRPGKKTKRVKWSRKFLNLIRTFRVTHWQIAIDTGDYIRNAWLYPLNFHPVTRHHLYLNFLGETYLLLEIRNAPWKIVYALIK